jgi:hypothetical protein
LLSDRHGLDIRHPAEPDFQKMDATSEMRLFVNAPTAISVDVDVQNVAIFQPFFSEDRVLETLESEDLKKIMTYLKGK